MRIAPGVVAAQADGLEVVADALVAHRAARPSCSRVGLGDQPLADDVADGHARVQRADRVLEDDLHPPAQPLRSLPAWLEDVLALERAPRRSVGGSSRSEGPAEGGLAAARLAHEAKVSPRMIVEADAVDGLDMADRACGRRRPGSGST